MKKIWNDEELGQHWSLTYEELELLKTKPEKNHLAFCMQLKYYQYYGAFPENEKELSEITVQYISEQLEGQLTKSKKNRVKDKIYQF